MRLVTKYNVERFYSSVLNAAYEFSKQKFIFSKWKPRTQQKIYVASRSISIHVSTFVEYWKVPWKQFYFQVHKT